MLKIAQFPDVLQRAFEGRAPNHLCEIGYNLASAFNRFYHEHHIISEQDSARQASWLGLSECCVKLLHQTLELLGIEVPERM